MFKPFVADIADMTFADIAEEIMDLSSLMIFQYLFRMEHEVTSLAFEVVVHFVVVLLPCSFENMGAVFAVKMPTFLVVFPALYRGKVEVTHPTWEMINLFVIGALLFSAKYEAAVLAFEMLMLLMDRLCSSGYTDLFADATTESSVLSPTVNPKLLLGLKSSVAKLTSQVGKARLDTALQAPVFVLQTSLTRLLIAIDTVDSSMPNFPVSLHTGVAAESPLA